MEKIDSCDGAFIGNNSANFAERPNNDEIKCPLTREDTSQVTSDTVNVIEKADIGEVLVSNSEVKYKVEKDDSEINTSSKPDSTLHDSVTSVKEEVYNSEILCKVENVPDNSLNWAHRNITDVGGIKEENNIDGNRFTDNVDSSSKVTLKRKSDSLALISSYDISSDSDEDLNKSSFTKPQKPIDLIDSSSDTETDSGSLFNLDSDDASNESSQSSEDDNGSSDNKARKQKVAKGAKPKAPLTCFDLGELPPIKDLQISVKEDECLPFGKVHSIVETLVVIESLPDVPALNLDSVLFTKSGEPLGEVFDVFGPVKRPYYTIRFKSRNDIDEKSLVVGCTVYCAPKTKYTQYVFIHQLARMKGSDASWKNDMEPPPEFLDYSDDEQERLAKKTLKEAKIKAKSQQIVDKDSPPVKKNSFEERMNQRNTLRNQMFIRNSPPDSRRPDWFRNTGGTSNDSPRSSGRNLVRPSQFTPIHFQRQANPGLPNFYTHGQNVVPSTSLGAFPIRNQLFRSVFRVRSPGLFPPSGSQNNLNGNIFPSPRPPRLSQSGQGFHASNNHPFSTSPSFSQTNNLDFQQQPNQFSFPSNAPLFQSQGPQFSKGTLLTNAHSGPFSAVQNSSFQSPLNPGPYQQACPMLPGNSANRSPFPCTRPLQPTSPPSFGPAISRPFTPNSPPYAPSNLFSLPTNMPPQRNPFAPSAPFVSNPHLQSFRPFKPK